MTTKEKAEKRKLAKYISIEVLKCFEHLLKNGQIPTNWDGHELRCWFADQHEARAERTEIRCHPRGRRAKEYKNDIIIHDL
jgi:hypothetical protein